MSKKRPEFDEYDWNTYTEEYRAQAKLVANSDHQGSEALVKNSYTTKNGIIYKDNLHGNWKNIYSSIHKLKPSSVFECGCGGMHHLHNIKTLMPNINVFGCDLLKSQLDWGKNFWRISDNIVKNVKVLDFSNKDVTKNLFKYDFVFSQAVIMHISHKKALQFVKNMTQIAKKNICIVEGDQHDYIELMELVGELDNFSVERLAYNAILFNRK